MIYIQTLDGLSQVSPSFTKEKIIEALGYTPANNATFYEDETGALLIADNNGYVIARIDENGLITTQVSATSIKLNDEDLATKLEALGTIDLSNYYTKAEIDTKIADIDVSDLDMSAYALNADVEANKILTDAHIDNNNIHVTEEEKISWTSKSNFSGQYIDLTNAPNIANEENDDRLAICDASGNAIMIVDNTGLNVVATYTKGILTSLPVYDTTLEGATLQIVNGMPAWVLPNT